METPLKRYWREYLATLPAGADVPSEAPEAWSFCDNQTDADELAGLVQAGIKTATSSLVWAYEAENEPLPKAGDFSIITNWTDQPQCIIQTVEVCIMAFNEVDAAFAADEGEGDRSLDYWRKVHWTFFSRECAQMDRLPSENMPVLCERFKLVFGGTM